MGTNSNEAKDEAPQVPAVDEDLEIDEESADKIMGGMRWWGAGAKHLG